MVMLKVGTGKIKNTQDWLDAFSKILSIYVLKESYLTLFAISQH